MDYFRRTSHAFSKRKQSDAEHTTSYADKDIEQSSSGADDFDAQPQRAVVDNSMQDAPIQHEPIKESGRNIDQSSALTHQDELHSGRSGRTPVWANMPAEEVPPAHQVQSSRRAQSSSQTQQQNRKSLIEDARTLRSVHHMPPLPAAGCFDLDAPGNAPIITGYDHDYRSVTARVADNIAANYKHNFHMHQLEHAAVGSAVGGTAGGAAAYAVGGAAAGIAGGAAVGAAAGGVAAGGIMAKCMEYLRSRESKKTDQDWDELVGGKDQMHDKKLSDQDWETHDNATKLDTLGEEGHYTPNGEQVLHSPINKDDDISQQQSYSTDQDDMASNRAVIDDDVNQQPATTGGLGDDFDHSQDIANGKTPSTVYSYTRDSGAPDAYYGRSIDQSSAPHDNDLQGSKRSHTGLEAAVGAGSGAAVGAAAAGAIHRHNVSHQKQSGIDGPGYSSAVDPNAKAGQTFDNQGSGTAPSTSDDMTMHNDVSMAAPSKNNEYGIQEDSFENQNRSTFGYGQDKSNLQDSGIPSKQDGSDLDSGKRQPDDRNLSNQNNPFVQDSKDRQSTLDKQNTQKNGLDSFLFDESQTTAPEKQASKQEYDTGPSGAGPSGADKYADYQRQSSAAADHKAFDDLHPASNGFSDQEHPDSWNKSATQSSFQQNNSQPLGTNKDIDQPISLNQSGDQQPLSTQDNVGITDTNAPGTATTADANGMHEPHSTPRGSKSSQSKHWTSLSGLGIGGAAAAAAAALTGSKSHPKQTKPTTDDARTDQQLGTSQQPTDDYSRPSQQDISGQQGVTQPTTDYSDQPLDQQPISSTGPGFVKQTDSTGQPLDQEPIGGEYATAYQPSNQQSTDDIDPIMSREANVTGQPLDQEPVSGEYATTYGRSGIGRNSVDNNQQLESTQVPADDYSRHGQQGIKNQHDQPSGMPADDEQLIDQEPDDGQLISEEPISHPGQYDIANQAGTQQQQPMSDSMQQPTGVYAQQQPVSDSTQQPTSQSGQQDVNQQPVSQSGQQDINQQPKLDIINDVANGGLRDTAAQKVDNNVPVTQGLKNQAKKRLSQSMPWSSITGLSIGGAAAAAAGALGGTKVAHMRQTISHIGQAKQTATDMIHPLSGMSVQQPGAQQPGAQQSGQQQPGQQQPGQQQPGQQQPGQQQPGQQQPGQQQPGQQQPSQQQPGQQQSGQQQPGQQQPGQQQPGQQQPSQQQPGQQQSGQQQPGQQQSGQQQPGQQQPGQQQPGQQQPGQQQSGQQQPGQQQSGQQQPGQQQSGQQQPGQQQPGQQQPGQQQPSQQQPGQQQSGQQQPSQQQQPDHQQQPGQKQQGMSQPLTGDSRQLGTGTSKDIGQSSYPGENTDTLPATNVDQTDSMGNTGIHDTKVAANRTSLDQARSSAQEQPVSMSQRRSEPYITDHPDQQPIDQSRSQRHSSPHIGPESGSDTANTHQQNTDIGAATAVGATGGAAAGAAGIAATSRPDRDSTNDYSTDKRAMPESLEGATGGVDDDALGAMQSRKKSGKPEISEPGTGTAIGAGTGAAVGAGAGAAVGAGAGAAGTDQQTVPTSQIIHQGGVIYRDEPQSVVGQKVIYLDQYGNQISPDQIHGNAIFVDQSGNRISPEQMQQNVTFIDQNGHQISPEQMSSVQQQPASGNQQPLSSQQQPLSQSQQGASGGSPGQQQQSSMGAPQQQTNLQGHQDTPYGTAGVAGAAGATAGAAGVAGSALSGMQPQMLSHQFPAGAQLAQTGQPPQGGQPRSANLQNYVDGKIKSRRASFKESMGKIFHRKNWQKDGQAMKADAQQKIDSYNAVRRASKEGAAM